MAQIKLSARLEAIARAIPNQGSVADIGTDHGLIPVWLLSNGHNGALFATDINSGPLESAKQTALEHGFGDKIRFFLCDGLAGLSGQKIDTVVIAGMGGETIAEILGASTKLIKNSLLVLQPMSRASELRRWLFENGYRVLSEQLITDGPVYELMTACSGQDMPYSPAEFFIGHRALISGDPLFPKRLETLTEKFRRAEGGLAISARPEDHERLCRTRLILKDLSELQGFGL